MPVSCLGDTSSASFNCAGNGGGSNHNTLSNNHNSNGNNSEQALDIVMTSSVLNTAEQFAFMQQTLLLQVRVCLHYVTKPCDIRCMTV